MRSQVGLTLIEVVVAVLILSVGALALAGSSAVMVRRLSDGARTAAGASVGRRRIESSLAAPCSALAGGSEQIFGVHSEWSVAGTQNSADIKQRVTYPARRGPHSENFISSAPCK
ncbi:MAG: prepilin-type N-terminal cleavage/methylation domain-containing protein [Gemmatimonadaceae bacterium]